MRLPVGLSVSSEVLCKEMYKAVASIPGTFPCVDYVKVQGSTEERYDINLLETVTRACAAGIKFNPDKCHVKKALNHVRRSLSNLETTVTKQQARTTEISLNGQLHVYIHFQPRQEYTHDALSPEEGCALCVWTSDTQQEF